MQHPAPTRPRPGSAGLAGRTGPSAALAGLRASGCANTRAGGVTWHPQYVGTHEWGVSAPSHHPDCAALAVPQLKQMEVQLEEEYEDKQKVLREKRELESKLSAVSEQVGCRVAGHVPRFGDPEVAVAWWVPRWHGPLARSPLLQANQRDFETEKRLRRDLKRTKALLADAQIMLDHLKNNAPSKREIAQLKNQV